MKRNLVLAACIIGLASSFALAGDQGKGGWDFDENYTEPMAGALYCNPCTNPPQIIEITEGSHHVNMKGRKVLDEGGYFEAWDLRLNTNHQGAKAIGYDVKVNEDGEMIDADGNVVTRCGQAAKATDENGNFITTEYSIPGHYMYNQNITKDGDHATKNEVFMCHMISHGSDANALVHYNGHMTISDNGEAEFVIDKDNLWCKCQGPDADGAVNCDEWPDNCVNLILY